MDWAYDHDRGSIHPGTIPPESVLGDFRRRRDPIGLRFLRRLIFQVQANKGELYEEHAGGTGSEATIG